MAKYPESSNTLDGAVIDVKNARFWIDAPAATSEAKRLSQYFSESQEEDYRTAYLDMLSKLVLHQAVDMVYQDSLESQLI